MSVHFRINGSTNSLTTEILSYPCSLKEERPTSNRSGAGSSPAGGACLVNSDQSEYKFGLAQRVGPSASLVSNQ